jgi:Spy/CpxP family protein refolding chaperone
MKSNFKAILCIAAFALVSAAAVRADDTTTPVTPPAAPAEKGHKGRGERPDPAKMEARAAQELGLTADQEAKWKEIGQRQRAAMDAIKDNASLTRRERRAKGMDTMKQFRAERRGLLTAEQQQKFDSLQKEMMEKMRENRKGGAPGDQPPGN